MPEIPNMSDKLTKEHDRQQLKQWSESELYKKMYTLVEYSYILLPKIPKVARPTLGQQIENLTLSAMRQVIEIGSYHNRHQRFTRLAQLDADIKTLCVLARVANRLYKQQITARNYEAWLKKLTEVSNIVVGWGIRLRQS